MKSSWAVLYLTVASLGAMTPRADGWRAARGLVTPDATVQRAGRASLRVEAGASADACAESAPLALTIGKRYELRGWIRTENLGVEDADRSPVGIGAALTMASMPYDVHSASAGGTREWTEVRLRFTATRAEDRILLVAGLGGRLRGRAWFDGVSVEEVSGAGDWPAAAAIRTLGPAYRYPVAGWIYLHIEGRPYERGYQHGVLMAGEIEQYLDRCARSLDAKSKDRAWELGRTTANAVFLRGFDREILEEMKGIADGAAAAGAKWGERKVDLDDIVAANTLTEIQLLNPASGLTPTGLEGLRMSAPEYFDPKRDVPATARCSAFAATGNATRDGKMVIGHITMWPLALAEQTNILLDVKPAEGHRVLMQSYPGGIQSGTDYYQNDAGVVLTETTIRQSPFEIRGRPVAYRARKAIQYGTTLEKLVEHLGRDNNGLYTNEWLIGDAKTNEIAMYELGTRRTKLYRSSRHEWFGGTEGFYWGCNNAKDLNVRLEYVPDPKGEPEQLVFVPSDRDIRWQELYRQFRGSIDEQFGFLAFRTAPLVSSSAMDAKVTTADMASRMMSWAAFGKPNQREWIPSSWQKESYPQITGLYASGYHLAAAAAGEELRKVIGEREKERLAKAAEAPAGEEKKKGLDKDRLWKGWILPASDADVWLTAGSAAYYWALRDDDPEKEVAAHRARFLAAALAGDQPLASIAGGTGSRHWFQLAEHKGVLVLDALRRELGDDRFLALMRDFHAEHTTGAVSSASFREAAGKAAGEPLEPFFRKWLDEEGLPDKAGSALYLISDLGGRLRSALIVYGTTREAGANRYAAETLQRQMLDWFESEVPVRKDFEASAEELKEHDVILVGRPETNSVLDQWRGRTGLEYDGAVFRIDGADHASETEALLLAAANPLDRSRMALIVAGNSALATVRLASEPHAAYEYAVYKDGKRKTQGFLKRGAAEP